MSWRKIRSISGFVVKVSYAVTSRRLQVCAPTDQTRKNDMPRPRRSPTPAPDSSRSVYWEVPDTRMEGNAAADGMPFRRRRNWPEHSSGGSRISEKGGGRFFFFFFNRKGGGDNFAKKTQQGTNHRRVFNSASIYQNIPLEIPGRWGVGGGQKILKKIGTKSCNSKHFW